MEDGDSLPRVQEDKESAQPVQYAKSTWRALAAVATEHRHALRHALDNTPAVESTGEVHQHHESTTISTAGLKRSQQSFDSLKQPADGDLRKTSAPPDVLDAAEFHEAVRAEVQRVTPKTTFWDSEKDVVVRLEFMRSGASRVGFS